jgi:hypothetical protein
VAAPGPEPVAAPGPEPVAAPAEDGRARRRLDAQDAEWLGVVSAGGLVGDPARRNRGPARTDAFVVNPAAAPGADATGLRLRVRPVHRPVRASRPPAWSRSLPVRTVARLLSRLARLVRRRRMARERAMRMDRYAVRAVTLPDRREVPVTVSAAGALLDLAVGPAPDAPILVHLAEQDAVPDRVLVCELVEVEV